MTDNRAMQHRLARPERVRRSTRAAALVVAGPVVACATLVACSGGNPDIELSNARSGSGTPVTVTVPVTVTSTVTATVTTVVTTGPTLTVTAMPPLSTSPPPYDQVVFLAAFGNVITDISALDRMGVSGSEAGLQLSVLAKHYTALAAVSSPPGLDPPSYYSRVRSLEIFANAASAEALAGSPQATARYAVIRSETGTLISMVNAAAGTSLRLPPPPTKPPTLPVSPTTPPPR